MSIYLYIIMTMGGKRTIEYPPWAEAYRDKGATIRKVKNGYALYRCTTKTLEDGTRKNIQEYLGMVTEKEGFIPKRTAPNPERLEYGLSHVIWKNYAADLKRRCFEGDRDIPKLAVIQFISGKVDEQSIRSSYLTYKDALHLAEVAGKVRKERIERLATAIAESLQKKIPDKWEYRSFIYRLLCCSATIMPGVIQKDDIPADLQAGLKKYGLKI